MLGMEDNKTDRIYLSKMQTDVEGALLNFGPSVFSSTFHLIFIRLNG